jgi:hypothetical protein
MNARFSVLLAQIRADQSLNHANQTENSNLQQQIYEDHRDVHQNLDNASNTRGDISTNKS